MAKLRITRMGSGYSVTYEANGQRETTQTDAQGVLAFIDKAQQQGLEIDVRTWVLPGAGAGDPISRAKRILGKQINEARISAYTSVQEEQRRLESRTSAAEFLGTTPAPSASRRALPMDPGLRGYLSQTPVPTDTSADPFSFLTVDQLRSIIYSADSTPEEVKRASDILAAGGGIVEDGAGGRTGPTAAELAIQRSQVQATNLATFISGTIAELELEIDAKRLSTEQALGEFNKRLDAFTTSGELFEGIQPYTIPIGAEYVPGFQPGGIGERLGIEPRKAEVIQYDPFAMADQIVAESQVLTDIGVPSGDELSRAVEMARGFSGG